MASKNRVQYWLKDWRDRYFQFPVNPEGVLIDSEYGIRTQDVLALGQVTSVEEYKARQFSIDVLLPRDYNPSYVDVSADVLKKPHEYVSIMEEWREARRNLRFIVTGVNSVSIAVYISKIDLDVEPAGEPGDLRATIHFVESVKPAIRGLAKRDPKGALQAGPQRPDDKPIKKPRDVVFNKGDTLYAIAQKYYGDGGKLIDIYEANKTKFPLGLASKPVGERLRLP